MKEDEERSLDIGMDAHLSKPFNSEKFFKIIDRVFNMHKTAK
jgi:CheY-like chemotaxis protein